jgi:hypothetical protein
VTDNEGRAEYMAGYNYNERFGDKKDYRWHSVALAV